MAIRFHELKVAAIQEETPGSVSIVFDVPPNLKEDFKFKAGQNITIKKTIGNEELRRNYSLCSAPYQGILKIGVKKVAGGKFSNFALQELKVGDVLEVLPPTGRFGLKNTKGNNFLAVAAGSGITPVLSMIHQTLSTIEESTFTLFYGNQSRSSIMFFEEIEALKNLYIDRFACFHILSREATSTPVQQGRISGDKLRDFEKFVDFTAFSEAVLCGPQLMIEDVTIFLEDAGMPKEYIHFELFTTPGSAITNSAKSEADALPGAASSIVHVQLDGRTKTFTMPQKGMSILDAAMAQGLDLPFACKGGVCCTCRAKLLQGTVDMDVNYALEKEEIEAGFILTCQSHPTTTEVMVDFDTR